MPKTRNIRPKRLRSTSPSLETVSFPTSNPSLAHPRLPKKTNAHFGIIGTNDNTSIPNPRIRHNGETQHVLSDINARENAILRLLLNLVTNRPYLFRIMGPDLEWLQRRAGELGYQLDPERSASTSQSPPESNADPIPVPPPSSYANPHVTISSNHNGSSDSEPRHGIHRVPTPMPGTRSNDPSSPQSTSSNSTPESNASSTLPNLPGLFHDWLTNPATHAQASAAINACGNERVQRFARKYIEVTEAIRERRKELGRLEMEEARCERSLGALDWDRRSIAGTLIGLRAESVIFPHVFPTVGLSNSGTASRPSPPDTFPNQSTNSFAVWNSTPPSFTLLSTLIPTAMPISHGSTPTTLINRRNTHSNPWPISTSIPSSTTVPHLHLPFPLPWPPNSILRTRVSRRD
ncbi:uncharacterized protein STEHIDRAFT_160167 [Stereum hirsutum FP-91666 SS1]|uniref:uncharacterized protein n=1 Tax=Stereum hirsutum (strain FP-91666) TaxID=721885 RepID=UPI00044498A4|nr:uncharacterized protein STEHIDRAFT_160167 [Stereum hirsutum FP-91666 SS1]EIM83589.1 hypothetical protein STEHIDRAFT_160167 [Stereum hirsutum FP-91666 SS1]